MAFSSPDQEELRRVRTRLAELEARCQYLETRCPEPGSGPSPTTPKQTALDGLLERTDDAAFVAEAGPLDESGPRITHINPAFTRLTGYTAGEATGRSPHLLHGPQTSRPTLERIRQALGRGRSCRERLIHYRKDGSPFLADLSILPQLDADGQLTHFLWLPRDVTEEHQPRTSPQAWERLASAIIASAPVGIQVFDRDGTSQLINESFRRLLDLPSLDHGVGRYNILSDPLASLIGSSELFRRALDGEVVEVRARRVDLGVSQNQWQTTRRVMLLDQYFFPVADEHGVVRQVVVISEEVTEREETKERQRQMERRLETSQRLESLGLLAGGVAHHFNNLLTGVLGYADLMSLELPPDASSRQWLDRIGETAHRAADLCRQMLAVAGRGALVNEKFDLSVLVRETVALLRLSIPRYCDVTLHLADGLPSLKGDPAQFRQVVIQLIVNASEAVGPRGGRITVTTGLTDVESAALPGTPVESDLKAGPCLLLEVTDNGSGIPTAVLPRIFDPFFSTRSVGRGLGLASALGAVGSHGGVIHVDSEVGVGSRFRVLLPVGRTGPRDRVVQPG